MSEPKDPFDNPPGWTDPYDDLTDLSGDDPIPPLEDPSTPAATPPGSPLLTGLVEAAGELKAYPMGKGSGSVTSFSSKNGFVQIDLVLHNLSGRCRRASVSVRSFHFCLCFRNNDAHTKRF